VIYYLLRSQNQKLQQATDTILHLKRELDSGKAKSEMLEKILSENNSMTHIKMDILKRKYDTIRALNLGLEVSF
jgi:hypothetical protein